MIVNLTIESMEDLQCKQCKRNFDENEHLPKVLPNSQHSICKACLNQLFDKEILSGKCPFSDQRFR